MSAACGIASMLNGADVARCKINGDSLLVGIVAFLSKDKAEAGEDDAEDENCESGRMIKWL